MSPPRPTFPLPSGELRKEKLRAFFTSKQVWIPFAALVALGIYAKTPVWALVPFLVLAFFVLALVWQARSHRLLGSITRRIVARSNRAQDQALVGRIRALSDAGEDGYAVTLGKFLALKQRIESRLHPEGKSKTKGAEEIEKLVDAISFGVADEFDAVIALEKQLRALPNHARNDSTRLRALQKAHLTRIIDAYKSVKTADSEFAALDRSIKPASAAAPADPDSTRSELDTALARLKEETDIAIGNRGRALKDAR